MENVVQDTIQLFVSILYQALPFVVLGAMIAGIVEVLAPHRAFAFVAALAVGAILWFTSPLQHFAPSESSSWLNLPFALGVAGVVWLLLLRTGTMVNQLLAFLGRHRLLAIAGCGLLGLVIPMCECGIIPVTRRLLRKGLPLSCCVMYILTGPIINIVVLLSTYVAFANYEAREMGGAWMMMLRAGMGYVVAFVTALVVEQVYRKHGDTLLMPLAKPKATDADDNGNNVESLPLKERIDHMTHTALHDFIDITVFLIIGSLFASVTRMMLPNSRIEELSSGFPMASIAIMMALAILLCLCSEADAFVAASFSTLNPAAKLAFLVLGPMLDLKLYLMYRTMFRPRLIWTIITCVVVQVFVYCSIFHYFWEHVAVPFLTTVPLTAQ